MNKLNCIIIGGGPAGMMAAAMAAEHGIPVILLEKNEKPGKKLYITGKGRCNLTNAVDNDGLQAQVMTNARFLYSAFSAFTSTDLMQFFESRGVRLVIERGRRVFPASGHASDITKALTAYLLEKGVQIQLSQPVLNVETANGHIHAVQTTQKRYPAYTVVIATGGLSYPSTGSTGDGYTFAKAMGHTIKQTYPSLAPLVVAETWITGLSGLSLKNIGCRVVLPGVKKPPYSEIGEMMFTPHGVTGPLILSASRYITDKLPQKPLVILDLKPGLSAEKLDERILRDFSENGNKDFRNSLQHLLPERLIETIIVISGISPDKKAHAITRTERKKLVDLLKNLQLTPLKTGGYNEAVITMGGVDTKEINPSTLMSKKINGLFFAGEVMDVDAMTGGYNLQIAFSTGYLAGKCAGIYTNRG